MSVCDCPNLERVKISQGVVTIKNHAFDMCYSLKIIEIPASVTEIETCAFSTYPEPNRIQVNIDEKNRIYQSGGGAFWNKKKKLLVSVQDLEESFAVPEGITKIGKDAFSCSENLVTVTMPDSVTAIEEGAFYGCKNLKRVTLPDGIKTLHRQAFKNCPELVIIYRGEEYPIAMQKELSALIRKNRA
ncbi:MAG: leucine-rich repeat domain-containing protein [Lachnoclostridium sp.]|nr:leucine-rich repeat domain-containing protein [Lachnospira sp.]MCM1248068.1 leucine-rich repeat domain-containing protein [Lachnoclostridium sp.]